jgi:hypothetical protein
MLRQNPIGLSMYTYKNMKDRRLKEVFSRRRYQWEVKGIRKGECR